MLHRSFKSLVLVVLALLVFTAAVYPQQVQIKKCSINNPAVEEKNYTEKQFANFIANLSVAITAENDGLRKSAVYFAGIYTLYETVPVLVSQLEKEKNSDIKILIALALYKMEDPVGMQAVEKLYKKDTDIRVKRMSKAILDEYENRFLTASVSEK